MGGLAGLGAFAGGTAQGLERGQHMALQQQRLGLADAAEARLRKQDARMDRLDAADEAARMAGAKVFDDAQAQYAQQWNQQQPGPTEDGSMVQQAPMPQWNPDDRLIMKAAKAHATELFKRGRTDDAVKAWSLAETKRIQMRGNAAQQLLSTLQMGGDIKGALSAFDDTIDNGHSVKSVQRTQGPDGKPVYVITRQDDAGNETVPMKMTAQEMANIVHQMTADPKQVAIESLKSKLSLFNIIARGDKDKDVDDHETNNRRSLKKYEFEAGLDLIGARGEQERLTKATPSASDLNFNLGEGQTRFKTGRDGNPVETARGAPKAGSTSNERAVLVQERLAAEKHIDQILNQLELLRGSEGKRARPALEQELSEAKANAAAIRNKLADFGEGARRPSGSPAVGASKPLNMPTSKHQLRPGQVYQTSRGPARWNGTAFEGQ